MTTSPKEREARHPIGVVVHRTGLSPHVIRVWERRYGAVRPQRAAGGSRLYSDADILRLRLLREATSRGRAIGRVAALATEELLTLVREDAGGAPPREPRRAEAARARREMASCLDAIERLDGRQLHALLTHAAVALRPRDFIEHLALPLLHWVGELWAEGSLCPAHERLLSVNLRRVLGWLMDTLDATTDAPGAAPVLLAATPSGQTHEFGAMVAAITAAEEGWRVVYLGADIPLADVTRAAETVRPLAVALGVTMPGDGAALAEELRDFRDRLGAGVTVLVGGAGTEGAAEAVAGAGVIRLPDLGALRETLRTLAPDEPGDG